MDRDDTALSVQWSAPARSKLKRTMDIVLAMIVLVAFSPLFAAIALAIRIETGGPVFHRAKRIGIGGQQFTLYKFRTMYVNAEERLRELQHLNLGGPYLIRIPNDPRVTRVGRVLRRTSLDELPQFWNVLRGEMSAIGPRPQDPHEVGLYTPYQSRRLACLPGITGLWQVTARQQNDFTSLVELDLLYQHQWSIGLDFWIILHTPLAMARGIDTGNGRKSHNGAVECHTLNKPETLLSPAEVGDPGAVLNLEEHF
jgi:lipopolysaccharide/colanic/teichoic acid biosynthesis glycosyltransferase